MKKNGKHSLRSNRPSMFFPVAAPDGTEVVPIHDDGREACWALGKKAVDELIEKGKLIWKPWRYVLIPHDAVAENMSLDGLAARYGEK